MKKTAKNWWEKLTKWGQRHLAVVVLVIAYEVIVHAGNTFEAIGKIFHFHQGFADTIAARDATFSYLPELGPVLKMLPIRLAIG